MTSLDRVTLVCLAAFVLQLSSACATRPTATDAAPPHDSSLDQAPDALLAGTSLAVAYSGYRRGQHPDRGAGERAPSRDEIREDLELLTRDGNFRLIRLYDSGALSQTVLEVITERRLPLKVMLGAWLDAEVSNHGQCAWLTEPIPDAVLAANRIDNAREVERAIVLARRFADVVVAVNVGNEALVTWNDHLVTLPSLIAYAKQVKDAIEQPVTTADNYEVFRLHGRELATVLDFFAVHTYPAWEGKGIDEALAFTLENLKSVRAAVPDMPIVIGEAGWPSVASEFGARADEAIQERYYKELTRWARAANVTTFVFEAFDEDWKGDPTDPDGAEKHWGLFTIDRRPKRVMYGLYPDLVPSVTGSVVRSARQGDRWILVRNGEPYPIRGVGGDWNLALAKSIGANSVRTWGAEEWPRAFARADALGMTVFAGVWLSHRASDYDDEAYKAAKRQEVEALAKKWARHPALLIWCLGNEIQLEANLPQAWKLVEELAQIIRRYDTNHPIATATAHSPPEVLDLIVAHAPSIDLLAVNSYAGLAAVTRDIERSRYRGPFAITEWGPNGHWETGDTAWGRPIEQLGADKVATYRERAAMIASLPGCVGSYVFLWGQKQERTPTWYSMFVEVLPELGLAGEATGAVDVVQTAWTGTEPENHAPILSALTLDGKAATASVVVRAGERFEAVATASDADGDPIRWVWELLLEPAEVSKGGALESRPPRAPVPLEVEGPVAKATVATPGEYRLFVYALDGKGKVGTGNVPFRVVAAP